MIIIKNKTQQLREKLEHIDSVIKYQTNIVNMRYRRYRSKNDSVLGNIFIFETSVNLYHEYMDAKTILTNLNEYREIIADELCKPHAR